MNSSIAHAHTTRELVCTVPEWGARYVESNTTLRVFERRDSPHGFPEQLIVETLEGVSETYCDDHVSLTGQHHSRSCEWYYTPRRNSSDYGVFINNYNFFQILLRITSFPNSFTENTLFLDMVRENEEASYPNGGRAKGGELVTVEGRGFHAHEPR